MSFTDTPFVKTGPASALDMFEAEAEGLRELAAAQAIRIPEVYDVGIRNGEAFIAIEKLHFTAATRKDESLLGERLAALHRVSKPRFGWHRDNTIGLTPQRNDWCDDWSEFYAKYRLAFQFELAEREGYGAALGHDAETLIERIPAILEGHGPEASLLHGDLWGGNWANTDGGPAIFDPAVYYGDRETDLAMTRLFGGFGRAFYDAYESAWPLPPGHERRVALYQLYHVLNHLNLFGSGYLGRAKSLIAELLQGASSGR